MGLDFVVYWKDGKARLKDLTEDLKQMGLEPTLAGQLLMNDTAKIPYADKIKILTFLDCKGIYQAI